SDMARTFVLGPQTENQRKLIELYIRARREAVNVVKPGVMVSELDNSANRVVSEAGYGEYYVRGISHGVGLAFEETPFPTIFPEDSIIELRENMTISIGHSILSIPGIGGVRVEDVYLVTDKGAELLVKYDEELIEV
ncbi:MAG: M24 family metallopeptidase, partial [Candidatus Methanomethylicia archaeon]